MLDLVESKSNILAIVIFVDIAGNQLRIHLQVLWQYLTPSVKSFDWHRRSLIDVIALLVKVTPSSSTMGTVTPASGGNNEDTSTVDDDAVPDAKATKDARQAGQANFEATIQLHH